MEATIATDCRRLQGAGREDSSKGESSKRRLLRGLGRRERRRERETRDTSRDLLSLYEESPYEESGVVAFEMQPMTPYEGDDENPHGKGKKKKADKGKAIYRDPWFAQNQNSREEEKRRQVEPGKFVTIPLGTYFQKLVQSWKRGLLRLTQEKINGQNKTKVEFRIFSVTWQS